MTERYLCIHGHFYQPPRENPWIETIEIQDNAYPYHDWNELITAECYAPNALSRILDSTGKIKDIVSNYAKISFDMGPTLLSWLERHAPDAYEAILEADKQSIRNQSGHGAAMAQCYNHMIMPLATSRDKQTQVIWGIEDFKHRFNRDPEGMWIPETAVDIETLDIMSAEGIKFTILDQHQAIEVKFNANDEFQELDNSLIDPSLPYTLKLPSGRTISIFFYDGSVSQAVAFEGLLKSGVQFADRLMQGYSDDREHPQLMHIATDGESYGHHHRFGDMALAYALHTIENEKLANITNYGEFLSLYPPEREVRIQENTAWSCAHGIERWRSDCGCATGANTEWNQLWRAPLRASLDWLRDYSGIEFERSGSLLFKEPWKARDHYINVILDRSDESISDFLKRHAKEGLPESERSNALSLLELQRHTMLMYTSCGWFFDDISGIEALQILRYAGRVIQLSASLFGIDLEAEFLESLKGGVSNIATKNTGADIYLKEIKPSVVSLEKVAAHYAISSLFEEYSEEAHIYSYEISSLDKDRIQSGKTELLVGRCCVRSEITLESKEISYALLHLGDHDFNCGVRSFIDEATYMEMKTEITSAFEQGSFTDVVRLIDTQFSEHRYSIFDLFKDEQRNILQTLTKETMESLKESYKNIFEDNRILMSFIKETGMPVPEAFLKAAELTLNTDLKALLMEGSEASKVQDILEEAQRWESKLDTVGLEFSFRRTLEREMLELESMPTDMEKLTNMNRLMDIALEMPFELNLWMMQNLFFKLASSTYHGLASAEPDNNTGMLDIFMALGMKMNLNREALTSLIEEGNA
jgi:alpha-amylase/alpha-mannosidase (GH57 family)